MVYWEGVFRRMRMRKKDGVEENVKKGVGFVWRLVLVGFYGEFWSLIVLYN